MLPGTSTGTLRDVTGWYDEWFATPGGTRLFLGPLRDAGVRTLRSEWDEVLARVDSALLATDVSVSDDLNAEETRFFAWIASSDSLRRVIEVSVIAPVVERAMSFESAEPMTSAVEAVQNLVDDLRLPLKRVLAAAGIKRRTFYMWRESVGVDPRVKSVGRLWALEQCVEDLKTVVPDVALWLHDEGRLTLLERGEFDHVLDLAVSTRFHVPGGVPDQATYSGDDNIVHEVLAEQGRPMVGRARRTSRG
jgi:hypothetical protein